MENSEAQTATDSLTPGELLRNAREAQDISKREMADRLNWRHDFVDAVEENRFEVLRGATFVSGYLRTYARLLGLPEEQVLDSLKRYTGQEIEQPRPVETRLPQVQKQGFAVPVGVAAALVLLLGMWWLGSSPEDEADAAPEPAQASEEVETPIVASVPPLADASEPPEPVSEPQVEAAQEPAPQEPAPQPVVSETAVTEADVETSAPEPAPVPAVAEAPPLVAEPLPVAGEETLAFRFSKDCWLEVRDGSSELIYADLRRAGDVLNVSGAAPFKVLVGDASAVELRFRDEAVDIPVRPGRTTSRFTVGE